MSFNSPLLSTPSFQLVSTLLSEPLFFPLLFPLFNPLFPNLHSTLPTSLPSANVHTFSKVARPQSAAPMSAQSPSRVPGRDSTSMGHPKGRCFQSPRFECSRCSVFDPFLSRARLRMTSREVVALIGLWQIGDSERNQREIGSD